MFEGMKKSLKNIVVFKNSEIAGLQEIISTKVKEKTSEDVLLDRLYDVIKANLVKVGNKYFALIDLGCLKADPEYQRIFTCSESKIEHLIAEWDSEVVDPLVVSDHEEEKRFYVIDGIHRLLAAIRRGEKALVCEVRFFAGDYKERQKAEAKLFAGQTDPREPVKPYQRHKANLLNGVRENVILEEVVRSKSGVIHLKGDDAEDKVRGKQKEGTVTGFNVAKSIGKNYGKEFLSDLFDILIAAGWHMKSRGLGNDSLLTIRNVYFTHHTPEVKAEMARILRNIDPNKLDADARHNYDGRLPGNARALYLEDLVCTNLGIKRLIDTDIPRYNPVTETMEPVA